ncbi:hypothetical protein FKW77_007778 [Venturia effusa]|uniref:C2H2-type domain-containing protein n=1 Tax=Venturia effusa TaxID=50376 RepID=A0A517LKL0_9PEZI|nr:hypothetical protein FKW77_007778 [Venturia effusa]
MQSFDQELEAWLASRDPNEWDLGAELVAAPLLCLVSNDSITSRNQINGGPCHLANQLRSESPQALPLFSEALAVPEPKNRLDLACVPSPSIWQTSELDFQPGDCRDSTAGDNDIINDVPWPLNNHESGRFQMNFASGIESLGLDRPSGNTHQEPLDHNYIPHAAQLAIADDVRGQDEAGDDYLSLCGGTTTVSSERTTLLSTSAITTRNYHHIGEASDGFRYDGLLSSCPLAGCDLYKPQAFDESGKRKRAPLVARDWPKQEWAFQKQSDYTAHMRKVHDESPFPCKEPGCPKVGGKGYYRKRDLIKHQKKEHPDADDDEEEEVEE